MKKTVFFFLVFFNIVAMAAPSSIQALKTESVGDQLQLSFTLSQRTTFAFLKLHHPSRLAIDFQNTRCNKNLSKTFQANNFVNTLRSGSPKAGVCRVVFDLVNPVNIQAQEITQGNQAIINIQLKKAGKISTTANIKNPPIQKYPRARGRNLVIVVDPGHGGKDPGATGPRGAHEKTVVLAIGKRLVQDLNHVSGITVYMTRSRDYYLTLRERLQLARKYKADLFISIHADAYYHAHSQGASVYALSERGATSEAARWLAQKENYSELGGVDLEDKSYTLRSVLLDLSQTATIQMSLNVGNDILEQLSQISILHKRIVEQAPFVVLKSPDIPSILVETGFITNPKEESRLSSPKYQAVLADALMRGINRYFRENPPDGTLFAAWYRHKQA